MQTTTTAEMTETLAIKILTPIAEFWGVLIHETEDGSYQYFDKDGNIHSRNTLLNKKLRLSSVKSDIAWYSLNQWL